LAPVSNSKTVYYYYYYYTVDYVNLLGENTSMQRQTQKLFKLPVRRLVCKYCKCWENYVYVKVLSTECRANHNI